MKLNWFINGQKQRGMKTYTKEEIVKMRRKLISHYDHFDKNTLIEMLIAEFSDESVIWKYNLEKKRSRMVNHVYKMAV